MNYPLLKRGCKGINYFDSFDTFFIYSAFTAKIMSFFFSNLSVLNQSSYLTLKHG